MLQQLQQTEGRFAEERTVLRGLMVPGRHAAVDLQTVSFLQWYIQRLLISCFKCVGPTPRASGPGRLWALGKDWALPLGTIRSTSGVVLGIDMGHAASRMGIASGLQGDLISVMLRKSGFQLRGGGGPPKLWGEGHSGKGLN